MLSILIPIYNYDVTKLVTKLSKQCQRAKIQFEIICFDDGSRPNIKAKNATLRALFRVNYVEMSENLGRSKIRNWLTKAASFEHLLFMDCDSKVPGANYIKNYIAVIGKHDVVYGGRSYQKKAPASQKKHLHWKYGTYREALSAKKRKKAPYLNFMSNNFMMKRSIAEANKLDESLTQYGYEDTLFALQLKAQGIQITHIDNPLEHKGLETNKVFLKKVHLATENLVRLYRSGDIRSTRLIDFHHRLKFWKILPFVLRYFEKNEDNIRRKLQEKNPDLKNLQLYKLYHFNQLLTKTE